MSRSQLARLDEACRTVGRDPATIRRSLWTRRDALKSEDAYVDFVTRSHAAGFTDFSVDGPKAEDWPMVRRIAEDVIPGLRATVSIAAQRPRRCSARPGALRDGHFLLKSGRHGDRYLEKFQVLQYPEAVVELCGYLADMVRDADGRPTVDVVVGPTTGGVLLAFEVARQLGVRGIFAEEVRDADGGTRREFRRGFTIAPGERVFLVDDILTTGGSLLAMLPAIEATPRRAGPGLVIADRSGGLAETCVSDARAASTRCARCGRSTCRPTSPGRPPVPPAPRASRSSRPAPRAPRLR